MKRFSFFLILVLFVSCGSRNESGSKIISVSIAPFKYFVEEISGKNFNVNVMVPPGANPHIYEPFPEQIRKLSQSVAYISNGYLGFEMTWLDRFYEINKSMRKLSLADNIVPIKPEHHHEGDLFEGADPHYWVSPKCALNMASSVRGFLAELDPQNSKQYDENCKILTKKILQVDSMARELSSFKGERAFMIYHPNLGYLARDYGLEEIAVENEGKEPSPLRLTELIDRAKSDHLKVILVQREYDSKNARVVAEEAGARLVVIDPLSEDWYASTAGIIRILKESFEQNLN